MSENQKAVSYFKYQGKRGFFGGGPAQDRTGDLLNAIQNLRFAKLL
jgi:hypothetical protein